MNRLQIMCYSDAGEIVEIIRDVPVPITVSLVSVAVEPGYLHGPWDIPCGHAECRASAEVRARCAREEEAAADAWERAAAQEEAWEREQAYQDWRDYDEECADEP